MPPVPDATLQRLSASLSRHEVDLVPHGQRRLLEVLRVTLQGAEILLLDEPAAGLSTRERAEFASLLEQLRDHHGKTVVLVEHDLDLVMGIADRITVLEAGRVVASGSPAEIAADPKVQRALRGSAPCLRRRTCAPATAAFRCCAMSTSRSMQGEIMLIVGENGAGKTTLLRTLGGFIAPTSGSVRLGGEDITGLPPETMPDKGLRLVLDGHRVFPGDFGAGQSAARCHAAHHQGEFRNGDRGRLFDVSRAQGRTFAFARAT